MNLRNTLLASAMIALPLATAGAEAVNGPYIGAGAGANFIQREGFIANRSSFPAFTSAKGDVRSNIGPVVVLSLGWGFGNGLRAEVEGNYRQNNGFNNPRSFGGPASAGGNEQKYGGMFNVFYDFTMVPVIQPYVGLGAGMMAVQEENLHLAFNGSTAGAFQNRTTTRSSFAYQGIVGAAYPVPGMPALAITAEYRFLGLAGHRDYSAVVNNGATNGNGNISSRDNYNHALLIGLRYAFNVAPAAPPPVVQDVGVKTFLVFFDWDKADLTARSQGIIRDAADYSRSTTYTRIDVDGNADTSGTPSYNVGLSERRAQRVAAELVRNGVPQSAISMHAYGDTKLLVPTGPGVREPQNRRVEIVYR